MRIAKCFSISLMFTTHGVIQESSTVKKQLTVSDAYAKYTSGVFLINILMGGPLTQHEVIVIL